MQLNVLSLLLITILLSCNSSVESNPDQEKNASDADIVFEQAKWKEKEGQDYPFRQQMLKDVVYNDTIRTLSRAEIIDLLGKPDREQDNHFYYTISQKRIDLWPLHTTSMVIKFVDSTKIEWIKIHE